MEFEDWFEELLELAAQRSDSVAALVAQAPFMYEDYHEQGLSPQLALESEWGQ
jgi:hypothetical protein